MIRRTITVAIAAAALACGIALVPTTAAAGNVAWGVSVGGPGFAVSAGVPAYGGVYPRHRGGHYGYVRAPLPRPYYRPYVPGPVVYAPPVVYSAPVVYPAPIVYAAPVYGPRRVVAAAPVWRAPRYAMPYGIY